MKHNLTLEHRIARLEKLLSSKSVKNEAEDNLAYEFGNTVRDMTIQLRKLILLAEAAADLCDLDDAGDIPDQAKQLMKSMLSNLISLEQRSSHLLA